MGSREIAVGVDREAASAHAERLAEPIFQPVLSGVEDSVDVYVNRRGEGESTVTETVESPELCAIAVQLAESLELRGHLVIQGFVDAGDATLIECNPRVGGASTLGFLAWISSPLWAIRESRGETVEPQLGSYRRGLGLLRYPADRLIEA